MAIFLEESKIFKNEKILSPEYLPNILPHRENQIKLLAKNLVPASRGKTPQNTFIFGSSGIGKTASAKFVFKEFEEYSGVKTIYINCWNFKTASSVLSKIAIELGYPAQRRGWAKDEILSKLVEVIKKKNKSLIICLDEVDQLKQDVLYDLLRINQYVNSPIALIFISNNPNVFSNTEPRIRSSLAIEEVEFKPYNLEEMKDILKERVKYAFHSVENGVVILAANHAIQKGGDVRIGLQCLLKAGRLAEEKNDEKVKVEHVKSVLKEVKKVKPEILKEKISGVEKNIIEILNDGNVWKYKNLYKKYCENIENPVSNKTFRECVKHLDQLKLIKVRKRLVGRNRIISKA